jgi:hypothetical protein
MGTTWLGSPTIDNGGEFTGSVKDMPSGPTFSSTAFWCVDDQLSFSWGQQALANIILLQNITADASNVRYGDVNGTVGNLDGTWTNNSDGTHSLPPDAQSRYEMAAWLVMQYTYQTPHNLDSGIAAPTAGNENNYIQEAIWAITNNSTGSAPENFLASGNDPTGKVAYWVEQARLNYNNGSVNTSDWAVVTWGAGSDGSLSGHTGYQTFLVQITPEPGFYGALALGLSGLLFFTRRKQQAS